MNHIFLLPTTLSFIMEYYCLSIDNRIMCVNFGIIALMNLMLWIGDLK